MPLRTWNGSSFNTTKSAKVWNGSSWVNVKSAKVWNGSSWVNFLSSVNITDQVVSAGGSALEDAYAGAEYILKTNGQASAIESGSFLYNEYDFTGEWLAGGVASDFSARATILASYPGINSYYNGTFGSWNSLSGQQSWSLVTDAVGPGGFDSAQLDILIELAYTADTSTVLDSATIALIVTAQNA